MNQPGRLGNVLVVNSQCSWMSRFENEQMFAIGQMHKETRHPLIECRVDVTSVSPSIGRHRPMQSVNPFQV